MVPDEDWVDRADEEDIETIETEEISEEASFLQAIHDLPVYDADGNEIPDQELPWRIREEAPDACDDSQDWDYQDNEADHGFVMPAQSSGGIPEDMRTAAERRKRVA